MSSWYFPDAYSTDICFCQANCAKTDYCRNLESEFYKRMVDRQTRLGYGLHSESDFGDKCDDYKEAT